MGQSEMRSWPSLAGDNCNFMSYFRPHREPLVFAHCAPVASYSIRAQPPGGRGGWRLVAPSLRPRFRHHGLALVLVSAQIAHAWLCPPVCPLFLSHAAAHHVGAHWAHCRQGKAVAAIPSTISISLYSSVGPGMRTYIRVPFPKLQQAAASVWPAVLSTSTSRAAIACVGPLVA